MSYRPYRNESWFERFNERSRRNRKFVLLKPVGTNPELIKGPWYAPALRWLLIAATSEGATVTTVALWSRVCSKFEKKNVRFRTSGPLKLMPYCPWVSGAFDAARGLRASKR